MALIRLMRPHQWVKNVFLFAAPLFGRRLTDPDALPLVLAGFVLMCLLSSAIYVFNDIRDVEEDRLHPRKRTRPLPSGEVSVHSASLLGLVLLGCGLLGSWWLDRGFGVVASSYVVLQGLYNAWFKHAVVLDVITIGLGFVLRAVGGAVLVHVPISPWLILCTFTLCLFMGFSKRRCELNALGENGFRAGEHRKTLKLYTADVLTQMTTLTAGIAIVSFMLYAVDERTKHKLFPQPVLGEFGSQCLLYTLPLVVFAVFRFTLLVHRGAVDGPTDVMLRDRPFQAALALWIAACAMIVYRTQWLHDVILGAA